MTVTLRANAQKPVSAPRVLAQDEQQKDGQVHDFLVPSYSVKELLGAIPAECYERSALHSSLYIVQDVVLIGLAVWGSLYIPSLIEKADLGKIGSKVLSVLLWNVFWFWTGVFGTGLWVIAHECGHQGFSESKTINNAVGWVLHSALGVPYHSWRISHARHHAATGHMTRDEVFVPRTREQHKYPAFDPTREDINGHNVTEERQSELAEAIGDAPFVVMLNLIAQQVVGWPAYLIRNASGQKHYPKWTNHFTPSSIIFEKRHRMQVIMSDVGIALLAGTLAAWGHYRGFSEVLTYYLIPYLYVNHWLVAIVYIQHTDPLVPHYANSVWTFPRGALTTIDRNLLWFIGPYLMHGIAETHVSHHVSSKIPHYNAWKATAALKEFLGPHYQYREGNFLVALYTAFRSCRYVDVDPTTEAIFYKDARGVGRAKANFGGSGNLSDSGVEISDDEKFRIE